MPRLIFSQTLRDTNRSKFFAQISSKHQILRLINKVGIILSLLLYNLDIAYDQMLL